MIKRMQFTFRVGVPSLAPAALSKSGTGPQIVFSILAGKPYSLQADVCFLTRTFLQYLALLNDGMAEMTRRFSTTLL
jgi:hypothetical protein